MEENIRNTEARCHGDTRSLIVRLCAPLSLWLKKQFEIFSVITT